MSDAKKGTTQLLDDIIRLPGPVGQLLRTYGSNVAAMGYAPVTQPPNAPASEDTNSSAAISTSTQVQVDACIRGSCEPADHKKTSKKKKGRLKRQAANADSDSVKLGQSIRNITSR